MRNIPGMDYPYSDHEGVVAEMVINKRDSGDSLFQFQIPSFFQFSTDFLCLFRNFFNTLLALRRKYYVLS